MASAVVVTVMLQLRQSVRCRGRNSAATQYLALRGWTCCNHCNALHQGAPLVQVAASAAAAVAALAQPTIQLAAAGL